MDNSTKDNFDTGTLIKDIEERKHIISTYRTTGFLDRNDAIDKIMKLRVNDLEVAQITTVNLTQFCIPFDQATNDQIIDELIMQMNILKAKLTGKQINEM